jgi:hypothetical protein
MPSRLFGRLIELCNVMASIGEPMWAKILMIAAARIAGAEASVIIQDRHDVLDQFPAVRRSLLEWIEDPSPRFPGLRFFVRPSFSGLHEDGILIELIYPVGDFDYRAGFKVDWHILKYIDQYEDKHFNQMTKNCLDQAQHGITCEIRKADKYRWPSRRVSIVRCLPVPSDSPI